MYFITTNVDFGSATSRDVAFIFEEDIFCELFMEESMYVKNFDAFDLKARSRDRAEAIVKYRHEFLLS